MTKLRPLCLPYYVVEGKKIPTLELWPKGVTAKGLSYSSKGYVLPCCWCPAQDEDFSERGFYDESLKLENSSSVEEIISSPAWVKFIEDLYEAPESAPRVCRNSCKVQDDC